MNQLKKIFSAATGYWLHKTSTLPIGADLFIDIHKRINYGTLNIMFDVGANVGQTWQSFRMNEKNAKIYCFEPVAGTFEELKSKTKTDKNCIAENIAFGEAPGEKVIKLFDQDSTLNSLKNDVMNYESNSHQETIKIDTVDNYCSKNNITKIDFLKIDTEGYELNVLAGAEKMLSEANIFFIYCEIGFSKQNNRNTYFADLTEWLAIRNYHFYGLYQLSSNDWVTEFGNALFMHRNAFKH